MRATRWEYMLRAPLHILIYVLGFWPFWEGWFGLETKSTWLVSSAFLARQGWLGFQAATVAILAVAVVFTGLGAWLRVWGAAYVGAGVVGSPKMHGDRLLTVGPYRYMRNPLYLGTLLHTFGIAVLMPPAGATLAISAIWVLQVRLALAEEPFLQARLGQPYMHYAAELPRFLPSPKPLPATGRVQPHWLQALLGEIYFVGVFVTLCLFGYDFNAQPLIRGLLISLGLSLVVQALLPRRQPQLDTVS